MAHLSSISCLCFYLTYSCISFRWNMRYRTSKRKDFCYSIIRHRQVRSCLRRHFATMFVTWARNARGRIASASLLSEGERHYTPR